MPKSGPKFCPISGRETKVTPEELGKTVLRWRWIFVVVLLRNGMLSHIVVLNCFMLSTPKPMCLCTIRETHAQTHSNSELKRKQLALRCNIWLKRMPKQQWLKQLGIYFLTWLDVWRQAISAAGATAQRWQGICLCACLGLYFMLTIWLTQLQASQQHSKMGRNGEEHCWWYLFLSSGKQKLFQILSDVYLGFLGEILKKEKKRTWKWTINQALSGLWKAQPLKDTESPHRSPLISHFQGCSQSQPAFPK